MDLTPQIRERITCAAGSSPIESRALSGGCIADVRLVVLADGTRLVAKIAPQQAKLALEAFILRYLRQHSALPVPDVVLADDDLLLISHIETDGGITAEAQTHAGELIAALHNATNPTYGFSCDTLIGPLHQPNPHSTTWLAFFRDHRLLYMADVARTARRLPAPVFSRLEALAGRLERWIDEPSAPSLLHGDLWTGNVLCRRGRIAGFVDPAIYYGAAEMDLAFSTLFGTFDTPFFAAYRAHRPLEPGFFEMRRDLYNLYPLLVHVRLFGGSYLGAVERTLKKFGC